MWGLGLIGLSVREGIRIPIHKHELNLEIDSEKPFKDWLDLRFSGCRDDIMPAEFRLAEVKLHRHLFEPLPGFVRQGKTRKLHRLSPFRLCFFLQLKASGEIAAKSYAYVLCSALSNKVLKP